MVASCASGPRTPPPSNDIDENAYRTHLERLAADELEGRKPGTPGEEKTVAYVTEQFRKLGLKPLLGESYVQPVPMIEIKTGPGAVLEITTHARRIALEPRRDMVLWTERRDPSITVQGSELVFVGYGVVAPDYGWNDYADADVQGKTVVVLAGDPGYGSHDPKLFKGGAMTAFGRWSYKVEEAARRGAAGVLMIHDPTADGLSWAAVQNTWTGAQLRLAPGAASDAAGGAAGRSGGAAGKPPPPGNRGGRAPENGPRTPASADAPVPAFEAWIAADAAHTIFAAAGLDYAATTAAAARAGFKPIALGGARVDARLTATVREFSSSNLIAAVPGSRKECVLYVAHWDHLGRDPALPGHNIFNGATENASGVAGLLTLAQSFVRTKPAAERTIVFLASTGGTDAPLGSEYYAANPAIPLRDTAAVLDLDALHRGGPTRNVAILNPGNTDLEETARGAALLQGRELSPEANPEWGAYYDSDSLAFARAGVPVLFAKGGLDDSARGPAYGHQQVEEYVKNRLRQPSDQYTADWDVRGAVEDLALYFDVGNRVARSRRFPRWYPNSEFRGGHAHHRPEGGGPGAPGAAEGAPGGAAEGAPGGPPGGAAAPPAGPGPGGATGSGGPVTPGVPGGANTPASPRG